VNGPLPRSRGAVVCGTSRKWLVAALVAWAALALPGFGLLVSSAARADDAHASGSHAAGAGHHVEIGHNPPEGVSHEEFESPVDWRRTDLALWSLAVFVLLLGLLGQFAWKPIMAGLDKREEGIESRIAETKKASEDAKQMLATYERRLAEASDEVRGMLEEARRDADATKAAIVAEAKKAADEEKVRARHEIGLARDEALSSIAEKAGDLAVEVAGKFLRDKIGKDDHARLVQDSVASLGKAKPSVN